MFIEFFSVRFLSGFVHGKMCDFFFTFCSTSFFICTMFVLNAVIISIYYIIMSSIQVFYVQRRVFSQTGGESLHLR